MYNTFSTNIPCQVLMINVWHYEQLQLLSSHSCLQFSQLHRYAQQQDSLDTHICKAMLRCIKDWDQHKRDIYKGHFNLLLFTVYINLYNTFVMK